MIGEAFNEGQEQRRVVRPETAGTSTPDPWKHRSKRMVCDTCMWFVPKQLESLGNSKIGRCRRHAPTMNGYPVVYMTDWCGDHKLNENVV